MHTMADETVNQAPAPATSHQDETDRSYPFPNPTGYLCENWLPFGQKPALALNPAAGIGEVIAWCHAEVKVLHTTARMAGAAFERGDMDNSDIEVLFLHRLRPLEEMLEHLVNRMSKDHLKTA